MKDTRIYEKQAKELISFGCPIILQYMCMGNYITEKVISPLGQPIPTSYTVKTNLWLPDDGYKPESIETTDFSKMKKRRRVDQPIESYSTSEGVISHFVAVLLEYGYQVSDIQKGGN